MPVTSLFKKFYLSLLAIIFSTFALYSQTYPNNTSEGNNQTKKTFGDTNGAIQAHLQYRWYPDTSAANILPYLKNTPDITIKAGGNIYVRNHSATAWSLVNGGGGSVTIPGGPITSNDIIGFNPGTDITTDAFIINTFYRAQAPTATLTGGGIFELTSASTFNTTLNWSASRLASTPILTSIVVASVPQTFSQPSNPGTVSGTQAVTVTTNTTTNYSNVVTASDGQVGNASTTFTYQNKIYAGFVTTASPTDADILAATGSTYVSGKFGTTRVQSGSLTTPAGSRYVVFAAPASFGTPTVIVNGLTVAFNLTTRSFTNASGYSSSYIIAVSPFPTVGAIDVYLVQ